MIRTKEGYRLKKLKLNPEDQNHNRLEDEVIAHLALKNNDLSLLAQMRFQELTTLDLSNTNLTTIEDDTFNGLQLDNLDLSNNQLKVINAAMFGEMPKLRSLFLAENQIDTIEPGAFNRLKLNFLDISNNRIAKIENKLLERLSLGEIDLSSNLIKTIDSGSFNQLELDILNLSQNQLESVQKSYFIGLKKLKKLILSENHIATVEEGAFSELKLNEVLDLSSNQLKLIQSSMFSGLQTNNLVLSDNQIFKICSNAFKGVSDLKHLDLSNNQMRSFSPDSFTFFTYENQSKLNLVINLTNNSHAFNYRDFLKYFKHKSYLSSSINLNDEYFFSFLLVHFSKSHSFRFSDYENFLRLYNEFTRSSSISLLDFLLDSYNSNKFYGADFLIELMDNLRKFCNENQIITKNKFKMRSCESFRILCKMNNNILFKKIFHECWDESGIQGSFLDLSVFVNVDLKESFKNILKDKNEELAISLLCLIRCVIKYCNSELKDNDKYKNMFYYWKNDKERAYNHINKIVENIYDFNKKYFFECLSEIFHKYKETNHEVYNNLINTILDLGQDNDFLILDNYFFVKQYNKFFLKTKRRENLEHINIDRRLASQKCSILNNFQSNQSVKKQNILSLVKESDKKDLLHHDTITKILEQKWTFPNKIYYTSLFLNLLLLIPYTIGCHVNETTKFSLPEVIYPFYGAVGFVILVFVCAYVAPAYVMLAHPRFKPRGYKWKDFVYPLWNAIRIFNFCSVFYLSRILRTILSRCFFNQVYSSEETSGSSMQTTQHNGFESIGLILFYYMFIWNLDKVKIVGEFVNALNGIIKKSAIFFLIVLFILIGFTFSFSIRSRYYRLLSLNSNTTDENHLTLFANKSLENSFFTLLSFFVGNIQIDEMGIASVTTSNFYNFIIYGLFIYVMTILFSNIFVAIASYEVTEFFKDSKCEIVKKKIDYIFLMNYYPTLKLEVLVRIYQFFRRVFPKKSSQARSDESAKFEDYAEKIILSECNMDSNFEKVDRKFEKLEFNINQIQQKINK